MHSVPALARDWCREPRNSTSESPTLARDLELRSRPKLGTLGLDLAVLVCHRGELRTILRRQLGVTCETNNPKRSVDVEHFDDRVHHFSGHGVVKDVESMQGGVLLKDIHKVHQDGVGKVVLDEFEGFEAEVGSE